MAASVARRRPPARATSIVLRELRIDIWLVLLLSTLPSGCVAHAASTQPPPAVALDVDWPDYLSHHDPLWRWGQQHEVIARFEHSRRDIYAERWKNSILRRWCGVVGSEPAQSTTGGAAGEQTHGDSRHRLPLHT
jgi:hypothetical protein